MFLYLIFLEKHKMSDSNQPNAEENGEKQSPVNSFPIDNKQADLNKSENIPTSGFTDGLNYEKYLSYDETGTVIYTDPSNGHQYTLDKEKNQWILKSDSNENVNKNDIYENEHYRWCTETNQWILKDSSEIQSTTNITENEHYKWNAEKNVWEPKNPDQKMATSVYKDGQHLYTDPDGTIYFWDEEKKAWFPKIDDDFMAVYQTNYGFIDNTSVSDPVENSSSKNKDENVSKQQENDKNDESKPLSGKRKMNQPKWFEESPENCTKVYVSNLPEDITEEEFIEVMSKCGMILRDPNTKKMKIKLYAEPSGQLKGDGLVHYIRTESVQLAIDLLDGYDVRGRKIKVQRAQFQMRGDYNPALKPKKKKKDKEKEKKLKEKLLDWRPDKMRGERSKHERVVIIKNMFSPEIFENHVDLIIKYQEDLRNECTKCGTVRRVMVYASEPEGIVEVRMSDPEEADLVVQMMHRRNFGSRILTAELWDGKTKFKRNENETETEKNDRLSKWDEFLEADESGEPSSN